MIIGQPVNNPELVYTEMPFMRCLRLIGWRTYEGERDSLTVTEIHHDPPEEFEPDTFDRQAFEDTILENQLRAAIRRINDPESEWLSDHHIEQIIHRIEQLRAADLLEGNMQGTAWLQQGIELDVGEEGAPDTRPIQLIDFSDDVVANNTLVAIRQFRVQPIVAGNSACEPDIVLFVNGLPLVVIECKRPDRRNMLREAVNQLLRYQNLREDDDPDAEGVPELFRFCQFNIGTALNSVKYGTIGTRVSRYLRWRDPHPFTSEFVSELFGIGERELNPQEILIAGMLNPETLLDLTQNYSGFEESVTGTTKIVPRYTQYRAADLAVRRLLDPPEINVEELQDGDLLPPDPRGGYVWHTQGSGKSLTMAWIAQKMLSNPEEFGGWKILYMTDRTSLEEQLSETPAFKDRHIRVAENVRQLHEYLSDPNSGIIFGMVQKVQDLESGLEQIQMETQSEDEALTTSTLEGIEQAQTILTQRIPDMPMLNESERILVIVDEGHRSHTNLLHANLRRALPRSAMIAFTGTPIITTDGSRVRTQSIFGSRIDVYSIDQAQEDGVILPIDYEGRQPMVNIRDGLDDRMEAQLAAEITEIMEEDGDFEHTVDERVDAAKAEFYTRKPILTHPDVVRMKARDILRDYVRNVMTNHCKGQLVAVDRETAVMYQGELTRARDELIQEIDADIERLEQINDLELEEIDDENEITLIMGARNRELLQRLEFGAVISHAHNQSAHLIEWSSSSRIEEIQQQFKLPLVDENDEENQHGMAIVCVTRMLTTGFSNKVTQTIYIDRPMEGHELLQTIARVNRIYAEKNKVAGRVVDYVALGERLGAAYEMYTLGAQEEEIECAIDRNVIGRLEDALSALQDFFTAHEVPQISTPEQIEACVNVLADEEIRAEFKELLSVYLRLFERVAFRPEVNAHRRHTKVYGFISRLASNIYGEDEDTVIADLGDLVQGLIRDHIEPDCIRPRIHPVRLGDEAFSEFVEELRSRSSRTRAAFIRSAIDHYLTIHYDDDSRVFGSIQERLRQAAQDLADDWDAFAEFLEELALETVEGNPQSDAPVPHLQVRFLDILNNPQDPSQGVEMAEEELAANIDLLQHIWPIICHHAGLQGIAEPVGQRSLHNEIFRQLPHDLPVETRRAICNHFVIRTVRNAARLQNERED